VGCSTNWRPPRFPRGTGILHVLLDSPPDVREAMVRALGPEDADALDGDFEAWAHPGQFPPEKNEDGSDWSTCVIKGGRGFGKTFAGAKWIEQQVAAAVPGTRLRIALVGATLAEARRVMVEGPSGLLEVAGHCIREWRPSQGLLRFRGGAEAQLFSGHSPELLRGPQHHLAWCDELAKWEKAQETWDMLQLGLRLGDDPRSIVTTTPRPGPVLRAIMAAPDTVTIGGPTHRNPHNGERWNAKMNRLYAGTRLGRQELGGEMLADSPGQLWTVELLESCREGADATPNPVIASPEGARQSSGEQQEATGLPRSARNDDQHTVRPEPVEGPSFSSGAIEEQGRASTGSARTEECDTGPDQSTTLIRLVIGVDPPAAGGTCGIVVCAKDKEGKAHVLADHSVTGRTPEGWSRAVADAARIHSLSSLSRSDGEGNHLKGGGGASCEEREEPGAPRPVYTDRQRASLRARQEKKRTPSIPPLIVAEQNQGGKMVETVLRTADPKLKVRAVTAKLSKAERAAPVAMLFEAGKVVLHGHFPELEAELCGIIAGAPYEGPGKSPDRADAMVWALTELMLGVQREPRVRVL
jgi:phage terminase large subunit-like protein